MRSRLLRLAALAAGLVAALNLAVAAAASPAWERGYPELRGDGCVWWIAQWSDGTYTGVPWSCDTGAVPVRDGEPVELARTYPERGAEGCVWYVVQWEDGAYWKAPFECPPGSTLYKDGTLEGSQQPPVATATPSPGFEFRTAEVIGVDTNCGLTDIRGTIEEADGRGVDPPLAVRVRTADGQWEALSNLSQGGGFDLVLAPEAKSGEWRIWVDIDGRQASPAINIRTDGPERCGPGSGGVQTVYVRFRK